MSALRYLAGQTAIYGLMAHAEDTTHLRPLEP